MSALRARLAAVLLALAVSSSPEGRALASAGGDPAAEAELEEADRIERDIERMARDGEIGIAIPLAERALAIRSRRLGPEDPKTASSMSDLGALLFTNRDPVHAEELIRRAADLLERARPVPGLRLGMALCNLAAVEERRGRRDMARARVAQSIAVLEGAGPEAELYLAAALRQSALLSGVTDEAVKLGERALAIHEKRQDDHGMIDALGLLGMLTRSAGREAAAIAYYNRALDLADRTLPPDHPALGRLLAQVARANHYSRTQAGYAAAEAQYQRAARIIEATYGSNSMSLATLFGEWSLLRIAAGDIPRAVELRARANEIEERYLSYVLASGDEAERRDYERTLELHLHETLTLHAVYAPRDPAALQLAVTTLLRRKARVLDALISDAAALRGRGPEDRALLDELAKVRSSLGAILLRPVGEYTEADRARLHALGAEERRLEGAVSARGAELREAVADVSLASVQAAIPEGATLVEIARYQPYDARAYSELGAKLGQPRYLVYAITREGEPLWAQVIEDAASVDTVAGQVRARAQDPRRADVYDAASRLGTMLFGRARGLFRGARELLIAPDGALTTVPFAALIDEDHLLVDRFAVTYLASGRDLLRLAAPRASRSVPVIFADPAYDAMPGSPTADSTGAAASSVAPALAPQKPRGAPSGRSFASRDREPEAPRVDPASVTYPRLPGTAAEARAIQKALPGATVYRGAAASEAAIKALHGPAILHVATHGFFFGGFDNAGAGGFRGFKLDDRLLRSGVALAGANRHSPRGDDDGILTALEVSTLDLFGTQLVVLSACETGVGALDPGEGVHGLRRALAVAGAETQVMSLWKVDDQATRDLMTNYYDDLIRRGTGRAEALRRAQRTLASRPGTRHPYFWASFISSGASGPLTRDARWTVAPTPPSPQRSARGCACASAPMGGAPWSFDAGAALLAVGWAARRRATRPPAGPHGSR